MFMAQRIALKHGGEAPLAIADARGLFAQERLQRVDLRPGKFFVDLGSASGVELKPGEETPVTLAVPGLPRDADVKEIRVSLTVSPSEAAPPAETTAGSVTAGEGDAQAFSVAVTAPLLPRNVQVRLEG